MEIEKVKSSWYLPPDYIKALDIVNKKKRILKSHQVELALQEYMEQYRELLKKNDIDLWK